MSVHDNLAWTHTNFRMSADGVWCFELRAQGELLFDTKGPITDAERVDAVRAHVVADDSERTWTWVTKQRALAAFAKLFPSLPANLDWDERCAVWLGAVLADRKRA